MKVTKQQFEAAIKSIESIDIQYNAGTGMKGIAEEVAHRAEQIIPDMKATPAEMGCVDLDRGIAQSIVDYAIDQAAQDMESESIGPAGHITRSIESVAFVPVVEED